MCWLHVITRGKAKLGDCPEAPRSATGNQIGTMQPDYWLCSSVATGGLTELWWRLKVRLLMLFHWHAHHCSFRTVSYRGRVHPSRFCRGCGRFEDSSLSSISGLGVEYDDYAS